MIIKKNKLHLKSKPSPVYLSAQCLDLSIFIIEDRLKSKNIVEFNNLLISSVA